jgi:hypothetical protein
MPFFVIGELFCNATEKLEGKQKTVHRFSKYGEFMPK